MRLTIVTNDSLVIHGNVSLDGIDLTACRVPSTVHALQWDGTTGHIELRDATNIAITELPAWALRAIDAHTAELNKPEPVLTAAEQAVEMRAHRDYLLLMTDWTQLYDISEETRLRYASYRQQLRDISTQPGFPFTVEFPEPPQ